MPTLSDQGLKSLPFPPTGTVTVWDSALKGFGVRVGKATKTFIVLIESGRRQKIGRYPLVSLQEARNEARRILAEKTLGRIKPSFLAYSDAKDAYLAHCEHKNRKSTYRGYKWRLENQLDFGRKNIADIGPRDVLKKLNAIEDAPMEKRYNFIVARSFFNWCVSEHHIDRSPMEKMQPPAANPSRHRTLTDAELAAVWHAAYDDMFGRIVKVLILTGQRRGEVQHITLDDNLATIPGEHTKNGRPHTFPVDEITKGLLAPPLSFNGWGKAKARLDQRANIPPWTLHDLRRTYATIHAKLGTPPHIIERILNHATGKVSGVAAVYNRYQYLDEMKEAVAKYTDYIASIVTKHQPPAPPRPLPKRLKPR